MPRPLGSLIFRLARLLMVAGQLAFMAALPAEEGGGRSATVHIERTGAHHHQRAHDEATCLACTVLAIHVAAVPARSVAPPSHAARPTVAAIAVQDAPTSDTPHTHGSRAPPITG